MSAPEQGTSTRQDDPAARRLGSRLRGHLAVALIAGPLVGLLIGLAVASIAFEPGSGGFTMAIVGAVVACTMLALLWAGYSSLESPDPGREPSDTVDPIADRPELVREEHDDAVDHPDGRRVSDPDGVGLPDDASGPVHSETDPHA